MKTTMNTMMRNTVTMPAKTATPLMKPTLTPMPLTKQPILKTVKPADKGEPKRPIVDLSNPHSSYVAVGITVFGKTDVSLLSANGKVVLFDTVAIAQQFVPMLGMGRSPVWAAGGEEMTFLPLQEKTISRAVILTGYDPYHLPAGMVAGLRSETAGKAWKSHIMWSHAFFDCGQFN